MLDTFSNCAFPSRRVSARPQTKHDCGVTRDMLLHLLYAREHTSFGAARLRRMGIILPQIIQPSTSAINVSQRVFLNDMVVEAVVGRSRISCVLRLSEL